MNDFDTWLRWFRKRYGSVPLSAGDLSELYNAIYFCDCESCRFRKSMPNGHPVHMGPHCRLPVECSGDPVKMGLIKLAVLA